MTDPIHASLGICYLAWGVRSRNGWPCARRSRPRPFRLDGTQLKLNAEVGPGRLRCELTDADGKSLAGFGRDDTQLGEKVGLEYILTWKGGELRRLKGKEVCLRVELTKAELYAVEVI